MCLCAQSQWIMRVYFSIFRMTVSVLFANHYLPLVIKISNYISLWATLKAHCVWTIKHHFGFTSLGEDSPLRLCFVIVDGVQAEEERDDMEKVKLDNKRILFNLLPAHVAQHFLMSNPRNMVSIHRPVQARPTRIISLKKANAS